MKKGRLQLRVDEKVLERIHKIAAQKGVTVSSLVDAYFRRLIEEHKSQKSIDAEQI